MKVQTNTIEKNLLRRTQRLHDEGQAMGRQGLYSPAIALHEAALAIRKEMLDSDQPKIAVSMHNLADIYLNQAQYAEAEALYLEVRDIEERTGKSDLEHAKTLNNLG